MIKSIVLVILLVFQVVSSDPTTPKYVYNSSDLSYLSNGIQFPSELNGAPISSSQALRIVTLDNSNTNSSNDNQAEMSWLAHLYDHFRWTNYLSSPNPLSEKCRHDLMVYIRHLQNGTSWAAKMYDASGRYSGQFFFGNDYWLGSSTLCAELANEEVNSEVPSFHVHFYVVKIRINVNNNLTPVTRQVNIGECLPKSCSVTDVRLLMTQEDIREGSSLSIVGVRPVPGNYSLLNDIRFHIIGGTTLIILIIIILSSIYDILSAKKFKKTNDSAEIENNNNNNDSKDNEKKKRAAQSGRVVRKFLKSFSAVTNGRKILNVQTADNSIKCIHGLRFFSIAWIILVHTYLEVFSIGDNKNMRIVTERSFMYQTISNATFSVDTFFFISGLLVTLTYFRTDAKREKVEKEQNTVQVVQNNILKFLLMLVYRFFRLTPAYLFVLGVNEIIMRYLHSYSVFSPAIIDHITCTKFWWRNALYVNNFYPQSEFCMLWSWYIANDTQFFVIACILILIAVRGSKHLKFAAISIGVLLILSWITTFIIAMKFDYVARVEKPFALFDQLYDKPWLRIGPYLIGMVVGYYLFYKNLNIKMSVSWAVIGWTLSLLCLGILVYGLGKNGLVVPASAFYASLGHTAWGLSLAWIIIACVAGYGGPFNALFSCRLFLPLSRLTYCAYLVHPVLMCLTSFVLDGSLHLHNVFVMVIFFGNVVLSFICAFLISIAFESPVVNLLKLIL